MKKLFAMLLVVVMIVGCIGIFTACDNETKEFKVGVIHINPVNSTSGYTYAHQQGIKAMQSNLGLKDSQIAIKDSIDDTNSQAVNAAIEELLAEGCNMIIGTSFGYMEEMQTAALANPTVVFSHGTGYLDTFGEGQPGNMNNYFGRIYQARYLSGIVAGLKASQGGKLGYVSAHGLNIAECSSGINAFALGVQAVNPTATVEVKTLNSWFDPANETAYAEALIAAGCEVIAQHCDTENPPAAAKAAGKFSIGYNSDMRKAINDESCLTSVVWNWGVYYTAAVREAMKCFDDEGNFVSLDAWKAFGNYYGSFADDLFGLAELSSSVNPDTAAILKLAEGKMQDVKAWDVFTDKALSFEKVDGVWTVKEVDRILKKADGSAVGKVEVSNITGDMKYWVAGVNGPALPAEN